MVMMMRKALIVIIIIARIWPSIEQNPVGSMKFFLLFGPSSLVALSSVQTVFFSDPRKRMAHATKPNG